MGTTSDKSLDNIVASLDKRSIFMAYSLNNAQPVQCTMISDQPYFYMDEEICDDEDYLLSEESFDIENIEPDVLDQEIVKLKNKLDAYERVSLDFVKNGDEREQEFLMDCHFMTKGTPEINKGAVLSKITDYLNDSLYAKALMDFAKNNGIVLEITDQVELSAYDRKAGKIFIRDNLELVDQVLLAVQELRRHWQHRNGALVHPLTFHPDQAVLVNRAQCADLMATIIRVAWDLKLSGHNDIWKRIENSSLSDLGRAHAREALADFRTLNNGKASSAVFETWFLSERCRAEDKKLIQAMLADYRGYVFDSSEASHMVSIELICALGRQPGVNGVEGNNYLAQYAQMIINDPLFTDVRDRSNANFLWFIKFEREFTETEQELQSSEAIKQPAPLFNQGGDHNKSEDTKHEKAITQAEREQLRQSIFAQQDSGEKGGDNVIHIQFGSNKQREGILS